MPFYMVEFSPAGRKQKCTVGAGHARPAAWRLADADGKICRGGIYPSRAVCCPKTSVGASIARPCPFAWEKNLPGKGVAAPSWRATNGRPYIFNAIANSLQNSNISLPNLQSCVARTIIVDVRLSRTGNKCKKDPSGGYKQHEEQENHRRGDGCRYGSFSGCPRP